MEDGVALGAAEDAGADGGVVAVGEDVTMIPGGAGLAGVEDSGAAAGAVQAMTDTPKAAVKATIPISLENFMF